MSGRTYRDVQIIADGATVDSDGIRRLSVRAQAPKAGSTSPETTELSAEGARSLAALVGRLEQWALPEAEVILLGAALADLLLPSGARQLLAESLASLAEDEGLRLRLTLDPALSEYPWEALWVARQQGLKDATGFLALDPRVSIVRDLPVQAPLPDGAPAVGDRRVLAALSDPVIPGRARLQLDAERLNLEEAFGDVPGMTVDVLPQPTADSLADRLADGADVFHYVGHGMPGALAFVGPNEAVALLPATQLAINLRARGVQLALLIACNSGVQPGQDVWGSVATGLVGAGVPAVIGMQYKVGVATAIRFDRAFYRALAAGRSVDEAMAAGRLAMYNATTGEAVAPARARYWRDWAVPVLYLRPGATVSLASADAPTRSAIEDELGLLVSVRANEVKAGGEVVGAKVGAIEDGHLRAELILGDVAGKVTGAQIGRIGSGRAEVDLTAAEVTGRIVGAEVDVIGGKAPRPPDDPD